MARISVSKYQMRLIQKSLDNVHNICSESSEMLLAVQMYALIQKSYDVLELVKRAHLNAPQFIEGLEN